MVGSFIAVLESERFWFIFKGMKLEDIKARIESSISGSQAEITDMGGGDHIHAIVIAPAFSGKTLIQQHRMVLDLFQVEIGTNDVHALQVKTLTPEQAKAQGFI
jgi:stress-induced morphogen